MPFVGEHSLMIDPTLSLAHTLFSAPGTQAILVGSGISRSAQVPTGWDVTLDLVRRVAALSSTDAGSDPSQWYESTYGSPPDYSALIGMLAKTAPERRALLQGYFEPTPAEREDGAKVPTPAHRAIAKLVASQCVRVILTTNFDRLMETALRDEGIEPVVVSTPDAMEGASPLVHQHCLLVKLHGDYLDERIKNTEAELGSYDPRLDLYLDRILDEFGLIICGWSGEWDPALRAAFERCKSRRYTTTWVAVGEPGLRAGRLIELRGAQIVGTTGADAFFVSLADKVASLRELNAPHPLTVATATATLKRYMGDARHRIRLDDLLLEEANRLKARIRDDFPFNGGPSPTEESIALRIRRMDAAAEVGRALLFHGARLAVPEQEPSLLRAIALLVPVEQGSGFKVWIDLARYPMAMLVYAGALGALAAENWALLRRLLTFRYRVDGRERIVCDRLAISSTIEQAIGNTLFHPQRRHTPGSDHLAELLGPLAATVHPDPEALFDELEAWVALAYLDGVADLTALPLWMPVGRFCWRDRYSDGNSVNQLIADADAAGADWKPLASGWFQGRTERWAEVKGAFVATFRRAAGSMH